MFILKWGDIARPMTQMFDPKMIVDPGDVHRFGCPKSRDTCHRPYYGVPPIAGLFMMADAIGWWLGVPPWLWKPPYVWGKKHAVTSFFKGTIWVPGFEAIWVESKGGLWLSDRLIRPMDATLRLGMFEFFLVTWVTMKYHTVTDGHSTRTKHVVFFSWLNHQNRSWINYYIS